MDISNKPHMKRQTFSQMFDNSVLQHAQAMCQGWIEGSNEIYLNYAQVGRIVQELGAGLMTLEVNRQERVAIMSHNCPQWLWADFSIINIAAVSVTIYPTMSAREMAFIINDSGSKVLYVQNEKGLQKALNLWNQMPRLEKIIVMQPNRNQNSIQNVLSLDELRQIGAKFLHRYPLAYEKRSRMTDLYDPMTLIYTSGTTGRQKGAIHTHYSMNAANCLDFSIIPPIGEKDVLLSILPLSHSFERQFGQMMSLAVGATIAYAQRPNTILQDMQRFHPTWFMAVPSFYETIYRSLRAHFTDVLKQEALFEQALQIGQKVVESRSDQYGFIDMSEGIDLTDGLPPSLKNKYRTADQQVFCKIRELLGGRYRFSVSAAGELSAQLCKTFLGMGLRIMEGYGLVETCNTITLNQLNKILPGSVGPLAPGVEGRIASDGEFWVRGNNLIKGYWNNEETTDKAFDEEGFFATGDVVEQLADGYIKLVDRKKALLVLQNGHKVATHKVESLFSLSDYIDQISIIGDGRNYVAALIVPNFDYFIKYFKQNNISYNNDSLQFEGIDDIVTCIKVGPDFIALAELKSLIDQEVAKANLQLENHEVINKYLILNRRFTSTADELTPTMKLKRKVIERNFSMEINQLYLENQTS